MTNKPQAAPNGWAIDTSAGTPILTYEACSVIQDEQAHLVMGLLSRPIAPQAAPLVPPEPSDLCGYMAWGRQCAEIAQAQAQRAEKLEDELRDIDALFPEGSHTVYTKARIEVDARNALQARVAGLQAGLSVMTQARNELVRQDGREVLALREALTWIRNRSRSIYGCTVEELGAKANEALGPE